jgi:hypothetical protein
MKLDAEPVSKYLQPSCPNRNSYLGIVVPERKCRSRVQAINGRCLKCGYRLALVVVRGKHLDPARLPRGIHFNLAASYSAVGLKWVR